MRGLQDSQSQSQRFENAAPLALKMAEGAMIQGVEAASKSWER